MNTMSACGVRRRVLFRVAAGPRLGYGHLVRCVWLADALGVRPSVSLRGGDTARQAARRLGCRLVSPSVTSVAADRREVLVIDDPDAIETERWCRAGHRQGLFVVSIHDLGIGAGDADLLVDGSVTGNAHLDRSRDALVGPRFAIVDPTLSLRRSSVGREAPRTDRIVIALGGGPRARFVARLSADILARRPDASVRVAGGLAPSQRPDGPRGIAWLPPRRGLAEELARCTVAITGGGVTAYEACGLGTPAVAVAMVAAQRPTIRAFAVAGTLLDGGSVDASASDSARARTAVRLATRVVALLEDAPEQLRLRRRGRALIDGRGAARVAEVVRRRLAWPPIQEAA